MRKELRKKIEVQIVRKLQERSFAFVPIVGTRKELQYKTLILRKGVKSYE